LHCHDTFAALLHLISVHIQGSIEVKRKRQQLLKAFSNANLLLALKNCFQDLLKITLDHALNFPLPSALFWFCYLFKATLCNSFSLFLAKNT